MKRPRGRPRKQRELEGEVSNFDYAAVDDDKYRPQGGPKKTEPVLSEEDKELLKTIIVEGEIRLENGTKIRVYPSRHQLSKRFKVSESTIQYYFRRWRPAHFKKLGKFSTPKDSKLVDQLVDIEFQKQVVEKRVAGRMKALESVDLVQLCDDWLLQFADDLREGRVKTSSTEGAVAIMKVRQLLTGGPDSRQEVTGTLTLESLQQSHMRLKALEQNCAPELTGMIEVKALPPKEEAVIAEVEEIKPELVPVPSKGQEQELDLEVERDFWGSTS